MCVELHASTVTSDPSYDNVQMLEDDEELKVIVAGTSNHCHIHWATVVHQVKLLIQALIHIWIFTKLSF